MGDTRSRQRPSTNIHPHPCRPTGDASGRLAAPAHNNSDEPSLGSPSVGLWPRRPPRNPPPSPLTVQYLLCWTQFRTKLSQPRLPADDNADSLVRPTARSFFATSLHILDVPRRCALSSPLTPPGQHRITTTQQHRSALRLATRRPFVASFRISAPSRRTRRQPRGSHPRSPGVHRAVFQGHDCFSRPAICSH